MTPGAPGGAGRVPAAERVVPMSGDGPFGRLAGRWVYGGALAAPLLVALAPLAGAGRPAAFWLAWLCLPAYMLHQWEEHDDDRFRRFVVALVHHPGALSRAEVFWINILGVWALLAGVVWLVAAAGPGWALVAGWLLVVNALLHLLPAIRLRRYNPGLGTALVLLLPLGLATLAAARVGAGPALAVAAPLAALALHAAILLRVRRNLRRPPPP